MALLIRGKTICPICGKVIGNEEEVFSFPALVLNPKDPLHAFNDRVFHADCFRKHELSCRAGRLILQWEARSAVRVCAISGNLITSSDDFFAFPYLSDEGRLSEWNFMVCSKSALKKWLQLPEITVEIQKLASSDVWEASALKPLLADLNSLYEYRDM